MKQSLLNFLFFATCCLDSMPFRGPWINFSAPVNSSRRENWVPEMLDNLTLDVMKARREGH